MIRRLAAWIGPALIIAGIVVLVLWYSVIRSWLAVHTGSSNTSSVVPNYNFWSGAGSDIGEYTIAVGVLGTLYHALKRNNCHTVGCWRIGRLPVGDGSYKVCKRHHAVVTGVVPTIDHLKWRHEMHMSKVRSSG